MQCHSFRRAQDSTNSMGNKSSSLKPRFSVHPEEAKLDKLPQPGLLSEETSVPRAESAEQPVGSLHKTNVSAAPNPTPEQCDQNHAQILLRMTTDSLMYIAAIFPTLTWTKHRSDQGCVASPLHTHILPCVLQFLHPIGTGESSADVLRQQSVRGLGQHLRAKSGLRKELNTL